MPALNFTVDLTALESSNQQKQRHRMVLALVLLLIALIIVVVKSRYVWFQFSKTPSEGLQDRRVTIAEPQGKKVLSFHRVRKPDQVQETSVVSTLPTIIKSDIKERVVVPYAEVISGLGQYQIMYSHDSSIHLPLQRNSKLSKATQRVSISSDNIEIVSPSLEDKYPLLARSMNLQGSVVLLARIDAAGNIESLQVLSGPEILATAAQEVLKQWHFKPHYQAGQAVETDARITVNFAILTQ
jgi:TonB family protein